MIDRENKRIINGYGTILVTSSIMKNYILIRHIAPPKEIGSDVSEGEFEVFEAVRLPFYNLEEIEDLERKLDDLSPTENNLIIKTVDGWELDFSNYNLKSIKVYKKSLSIMKTAFQLSLAC